MNSNHVGLAPETGYLSIFLTNESYDYIRIISQYKFLVQSLPVTSSSNNPFHGISNILIILQNCITQQGFQNLCYIFFYFIYST